tara:strand:- start:308 stop:439 length:132 start_codon:yes stop_codon:yes gene_type:complete
MYSLQGFEGGFLVWIEKSDSKHRVAGKRHGGYGRIRAWRTTQK